jgi:hypothetical protein
MHPDGKAVFLWIKETKGGAAVLRVLLAVTVQ